jgi:hypothetical protein
MELAGTRRSATSSCQRTVRTVVVQFELDRRNVADRGVQPGRVEPVDPDQRGQLEFVHGPERAVDADALVLVETDARVNQGVDAPISVNQRSGDPFVPGGWAAHGGPEFAGAASLEAADDLGLGLVFGGAPDDIGLGRFVSYARSLSSSASLRSSHSCCASCAMRTSTGGPGQP